MSCSNGTVVFSLVSLLATSATPFCKSLAPNAILTGTPFNSYSANIHPEHRPFDSQELAYTTFDDESEYEIEEDEKYYRTRLPTSSRRYQVSPEQIIQRGNQRLHVRYVDVPKRKSRQQLPAPRERYTEEVEVLPQAKRHLHPVAWFGIFLTLLLLGWIGLNFANSWYQGIQNDWTYGTQRHYEVDAVVGHNNDSAAHPSHFTAENNNGQIIVIELPAGDVSKAKIYQIETVPGNAGNPPVKLSFQDMNGDGRPDCGVSPHRGLGPGRWRRQVRGRASERRCSK